MVVLEADLATIVGACWIRTRQGCCCKTELIVLSRSDAATRAPTKFSNRTREVSVFLPAIVTFTFHTLTSILQCSGYM